MKKARLFKNGDSQAVRLPKEFRFEGKDVYIKRVGRAVVLLPVEGFWDSLIDSVSGFSDDFMGGRVFDSFEKREKIFS